MDYEKVADQYATWKQEDPSLQNPNFQERLAILGDMLAILNLHLGTPPLNDIHLYLIDLGKEATDAQNAFERAEYSRRPTFTEAVTSEPEPKSAPQAITESVLTGKYVAAKWRVTGWSAALLILGMTLAVVAGLKSEYFGKATFGTSWDYLTLVAYGLGIQAVTELIFSAVNALDTRIRLP